MATKRQAKLEAIEALVIAALDVLDCELTDEERAKADEVYDIASALEEMVKPK